MKELVKWILLEAILIVFCIFGILGCSLGARLFFIKTSETGLLLSILCGSIALTLTLFVIGFIVAVAFMIALSFEINTEIIAEIRLNKKSQDK